MVIERLGCVCATALAALLMPTPTVTLATTVTPTVVASETLGWSTRIAAARFLSRHSDELRLVTATEILASIERRVSRPQPVPSPGRRPVPAPG